MAGDRFPLLVKILDAADVIDCAAAPLSTGEVMAAEVAGVTKLMSCKYFEVLRIRARESQSPVVAQDHPFMCLSVVWGEGMISCDAGVWPVRRGDHLVATAGCGTLRFDGVFSVIARYVPEEA